jgi:prenyltransferase beta subunit
LRGAETDESKARWSSYYMKVRNEDKQRLVEYIAKYRQEHGKMPTSQESEAVVPGYRPQQYAAIIAHSTLGTYGAQAKRDDAVTPLSKEDKEKIIEYITKYRQ